MSRHVLAALFLVGCLLLSVPFLLMQHVGVVSASLNIGFLLPFDNPFHAVCLLAIGGLSAGLGKEMIALLPLSALLMLLMGGLSQLDTTTFPEGRMFMAGGILLFALSVSVMRRTGSLISVAPVAVWTYLTGGGYIIALSVAPVQLLYIVIGMIISAGFLIAIGVALATMLMELGTRSLGKLKVVGAIASIFTLF